MRFQLRHCLTCVAVALVANTAVADTPRIDQRQQNQEARIAQGVQSGALTRGETGRLIQGQAELRRMENRAKHDGEVTNRERARLHNKANAESRQIRRTRNNNRQRPSAG